MIEKSIKSVTINKFRHLENLNFKLGKHLTIISGCNGTGKTSLLGLIGHVFTYTKYSTIYNQPFETLFSEIFRFSDKFDIGGTHKYSVTFNDNTVKSAISRETTEKGKKRFRIDVGERVSKQGKIERPVVYLGLKRLIPLAQETESTIKFNTEDNLSIVEKELFNNLYNQVFVTDFKVNPSHTKSQNKENYIPVTDKYDAYGVSAGQDNIGQIILAIISFKKLKAIDNSYSGGIILIDEIDAALYPASQKNLLELLLKQARDLDLQIIFTTHSTDILNYLFSRKNSHFKHSTEFVYLDNTLSKIKILQDNLDLQSILADLNHEALVSTKPKKINFYFEDSEGKLFFNNLIKNKGLSVKIKYQNVSLGCGHYSSLIKAKFPEFNNSIIVLDGDYKGKLEKKYLKRVVFLPGSVRPENVIKDFLMLIREDDIFWDKSLGGYNKKAFSQSIIGLSDDRTSMKNWFNKNKIYWGRGCSKLFNRWKNENLTEVSLFISDLTKKLDSILR
jgi:predicted ATPase